MSLIKTNSVLIAFDSSYLNNTKEFNFLPFLQNAKLSTKINNIDKKFIGTQSEVSYQFLPPEITLDLSYIQRDDFYNEKIFGFYINNSETETETILSKFSKNYFYNSNAFLLTTPDEIDLTTYILQNGFNSTMIAFSMGNLFLNSYSFSYSNGSLPIVNATFTTNKLKVSNLSNLNSINYLNNWDLEQLALKRKKIDYLVNLTDQSLYNNIVYRMDYLSLESDLNTAQTPITSLSSFSSGIISSMSFSLNFNREENYFFEKDLNYSPNRNLTLPLIGTISINGIVDNFKSSDLNLLYNTNNKFSISVTINNGNTIDGPNIYKLLFENLRIDSFDYSTNINERIQYNMQCTFKVNQINGFKIIKVSSFEKVDFLLYSSEDSGIESSESIMISTPIDDLDDGY